MRHWKVENEILRSKQPARVPLTEKEKSRLCGFAEKLGRALDSLATIVHPDTIRRWLREGDPFFLQPVHALLPFHLERQPQDLGGQTNVAGRQGVGDPLDLDLLGRQVPGHVDGDFFQAELVGRLEAGVTADDHALGVDDDRLAETELLDARGNCIDSVIVAAGIVRVWLYLVDRPNFEFHNTSLLKLQLTVVFSIVTSDGNLDISVVEFVFQLAWPRRQHYDVTMPDNIQNDDATRSKRNRKARPISLRSLFALTAVFALWLVLLSDFRQEPIAIVVIWSFAIFSGVAAHALYIYVLPWRGTVLISLLVLPVLLFISSGLLLGSTESMLWILMAPVAFITRESWSERLFFTIPYIACAAALASAHPIKPSLPNAIISAMGISIGYGMAFLIAASAG